MTSRDLVPVPPMFVLALLSGCSHGLGDSLFPTGSASIVADGDTTWAVNVDEGTLSRVDLATESVTEGAVGLEPSRVARAGDALFVSLRGERAIAVVDPSTLEVLDRIEVGPEPVGVVASEDGKLLFAAVSLADEVVEIDVASRQVTRRFAVPDQPRWLALHPSGKSLFAASAFNGTLTRIKLGSGATELVPLPVIEQFRLDGEEEMVTLSSRITGDIAISPAGDLLGLPALYVDNHSRVVPGEEDEEFIEESSDGYASAGSGPSRFNPTIVSIPLGSGGDAQAGKATPIFVTAFADPVGLGSFDFVRSYLSSVAVSPNNMAFVATMEGSNAVIVVPTTSDDGGTKGEFEFRTNSVVVTDDGPRGVAFVDEENIAIHAFLDRSVASFSYATLQEDLREQLGSGGGDREEVFFDTGSGAFFGESSGYRTGAGIAIAEPGLPWEIEQGRRMFYSAADSRMVASGGGVSCATCHYDGRNDGLTWELHTGPRNTPSLAGNITATAPVTWTDSVPSVADEAMLTTSLRMGGSGLTTTEAAYIQAYVDFTALPDNPLRGSDDEAVQRGKAIFERADTECSTCHSGDYLDDNELYDMLGVQVRTRSLLGLSATAPYLHDGSAATLEDVLVLTRAGEMGDTSMLSASEEADLLAYLKSL